MLAYIELGLGWLVVISIIIATVKTQMAIQASRSRSSARLLQGLEKHFIAFGFTLIALAQLTTLAALYYPHTLGIIIFSINVPVVYLAHQARKEIEDSLRSSRK